MEMDSKVSHIHSQLDDLTAFLNRHRNLMQSHLNDYFSVHNVAEGTETNENRFFSDCNRIGVFNCCFDAIVGECHPYCTRLKKDIGESCTITDTTKFGNTFMSIKKFHEINAMSLCIQNMCENIGCSTIVDIGSGKGYLGHKLLELSSECSVIGIEGNSSCVESAVNRLTQLEKRTGNEDCSRMKTITFEINHQTAEDSGFVEIIKQNSHLNIPQASLVTGKSISNPILAGSAVMVGLHTCGDLTCHSLKLFSRQPYFRGLHIVGCCYNLITENSIDNTMTSNFPLSKYVQEKGFNLGKVARHLACQSPEKWLANKQVLHISLLYRAILQRMVQDLFFEPSVLDKVRFRKLGKKSTSFLDYVAHVCKFLSEEHSKILISVATEYESEYAGCWDEMRSYHWSRMQLAPCIEKLIVLDRLCYLFEAGFSNASLIKMFTPQLSPRCYSLICEKS